MEVTLLRAPLPFILRPMMMSSPPSYGLWSSSLQCDVFPCDQIDGYGLPWFAGCICAFLLHAFWCCRAPSGHSKEKRAYMARAGRMSERPQRCPLFSGRSGKRQILQIGDEEFGTVMRGKKPTSRPKETSPIAPVREKPGRKRQLYRRWLLATRCG